MNYIATPIDIALDGGKTHLSRPIDEHRGMLDNLVELIVFTPRGSFGADPDFGFEYWNHEFSNVQYRAFNNDQSIGMSKNMLNEITREECHESIRRSLHTYAPQLKNVVVDMKLEATDSDRLIHLHIQSKYVVNITVRGELDDGAGTTTQYEKKVNFLIEPTLKKKISI